jgi:hypothetical protein
MNREVRTIRSADGFGVSEAGGYAEWLELPERSSGGGGHRMPSWMERLLDSHAPSLPERCRLAWRLLLTPSTGLPRSR